MRRESCRGFPEGICRGEISPISCVNSIDFLTQCRRCARRLTGAQVKGCATVEDLYKDLRDGKLLLKLLSSISGDELVRTHTDMHASVYVGVRERARVLLLLLLLCECACVYVRACGSFGYTGLAPIS